MDAHSAMNRRKAACRALLLGVAVGDALGVPVEFRARGSFHVDGMRSRHA